HLFRVNLFPVPPFLRERVSMPRTKLYPDKRTKWRENKRRQRHRAVATVAPDVPCRQCGPHCTVYCGDWRDGAKLWPRQAVVVPDPPYRVGKAGFDYTKARRRPSHWDQNQVGVDQPCDPTPWLGFPEVILFGANHYWDPRLAGGSWVYWDKTAGKEPGD